MQAAPLVFPTRSRAARWRAIKRTAVAYGFLAPALVFFSVFFLFPIGFSLAVSFRSWDMLRPLSRARSIGWENYRYVLFDDPLWWTALKNTLVFAGGSVLLGAAIALVLAFVFTRSRYKVVWRTIYWLPVVTNVVAIAYMWKYLMDPAYGMLNFLLNKVGLPSLQWLQDPSIALPSIILVAVWASLGLNMILFSAGLESIPMEYYEAARVDGASTWNEFSRITVPLLRPTLLFVLVTGFIGALGSFALIIVITTIGGARPGGPLNSTLVAGLYMYETAFSNLRMGRGSAMAFLLFLVILAITLAQLRIFRRGGVESY